MEYAVSSALLHLISGYLFNAMYQVPIWLIAKQWQATRYFVTYMEQNTRISRTAGSTKRVPHACIPQPTSHVLGFAASSRRKRGGEQEKTYSTGTSAQTGHRFKHKCLISLSRDSHWWLSLIVCHKCTVVDNGNICNSVSSSGRDIKLQRTYMWKYLQSHVSAKSYVTERSKHWS
jgi:hypothetical protein